MTADQVPEGAPISKRFGLRQKHKIRLIDDFSESCVNQTVTVFESPTLHTIDVACAAVACWFGDCMDAGVASDLQVKTFDLASAYRQVGLNANGRRVAYIRVWNPNTSSWAYFQAQVLPFGAVRSVHSFLRLARAIWKLGTTACLLVWSSFFDHYIVLSTPTLAKSTELTASSLFSLLGWDYAKEGRKCVPFSASCEALGVNFDLSQSGKGLCFVSNTQSRVAELVTELEKTVAAGEILQSDAQRFRGRMQFADSQLYGRTGKRCSKALRDAACRRATKLRDCDLLALQLFSALLSTRKPRTVFWDSRPAVVIYTDACYEKESKKLVCGLGGVLVDGSSGEKFFFSISLDATQRAALGELTKQQIIFEAETLAGVLAYWIWEKFFEKRNCLLYLDNEGTKFCLIKGSSDNAVVDILCAIFAELEMQIETSCWLARVPSHSNIADKPSRAEVTELLENGYKDHSKLAAEKLKDLLAFMTLKVGRKAECVVRSPCKNERALASL